MDFDVVVIGTGFGGAIAGCRLAEAGYRVLFLERGRRWTRETYPRSPGDPWRWSYEHPERENGWIDFRVFPGMAVAQGAGLGGGSLIYANVSVEAPRKAFVEGWPAEITHQELKPYYDAVGAFLNVKKVPDGQWTDRMKLMKEAADRSGFGDRFQTLDLAVSFDPQWTYADWPDGGARSKPFVNAQGAPQGTCVHLGNCDIGCDVGARNTLDLTYLYWAENRHRAEARPLHLVTHLEPVAGGFRVHYDRLENGGRIAGSATARIVVVAAGSLGSTELLLRCRDVTRTLPDLSPQLGRGWCCNGDFLTPAEYVMREVQPTRGPTIASAIDFHDGSRDGQAFWIQDGGFPNLVADFLGAEADGTAAPANLRVMLRWLQVLLRRHGAFRGIMPWFAQGVDEGGGTLSLRGEPVTGLPRLHLDWQLGQSERLISAIVRMHERLSVATGGLPLVPPTWSLFRDLVTPHPLGGCNMGRVAAEGVVDHRGAVFGYPGLYVADGAIVPRALGVNPSRTIGALAERVARLIVAEGH